MLNNGMVRFKEFVSNQDLREGLESQKIKDLQSIWADTFKALGLDGMPDKDAAQHSLSNITYGQRNAMRSPASQFKGKQAALKRLENGQIFARLQKVGDPQLRQNVEDARRWLDLNDKEHAANASTTVNVLLQKLFGQDNFDRFMDQDVPRPDTAKAQVQPQPPKQNPVPAGSMNEPPDVSGGMGAPPPTGGPMGAQPQVQPGMIQPPPTNPMPPRPAGAQMGLF